MAEIVSLLKNRASTIGVFLFAHVLLLDVLHIAEARKGSPRNEKNLTHLAPVPRESRIDDGSSGKEPLGSMAELPTAGFPGPVWHPTLGSRAAQPHLRATDGVPADKKEQMFIRRKLLKAFDDDAKGLSGAIVNFVSVAPAEKLDGHEYYAVHLNVRTYDPVCPDVDLEGHDEPQPASLWVAEDDPFETVSEVIVRMRYSDFRSMHVHLKELSDLNQIQVSEGLENFPWKNYLSYLGRTNDVAGRRAHFEGLLTLLLGLARSSLARAALLKKGGPLEAAMPSSLDRRFALYECVDGTYDD